MANSKAKPPKCKKKSGVGERKKKKPKQQPQPVRQQPERAAAAPPLPPAQEEEATRPDFLLVDEPYDTERQLELQEVEIELEKAIGAQSPVDTNKILNKHGSRRNAIAYVFIHVHGAPGKDTWNKLGPGGGAAAKIKNALGIDVKTDINKTLEEIKECFDNGEQYNPKVKPGRGRKPSVKENSEEERLVAENIEAGFSIEEATENINRKLREDHLRKGVT